MKVSRIAIAMGAVVFALTMMVGCGGGNNAAVGPVVMVAVPYYGGAIPHFHATGFTEVSSFAGPIGRYSFTVTTPAGSPPDNTGRWYRLNVTQVTEAGAFVRYIIPDIEAEYDLSPAGLYHAEYFVTPSAPPAPLVAECWIQTGDFPPPSQ